MISPRLQASGAASRSEFRTDPADEESFSHAILQDIQDEQNARERDSNVEVVRRKGLPINDRPQSRVADLAAPSPIVPATLGVSLASSVGTSDVNRLSINSLERSRESPTQSSVRSEDMRRVSSW